jgi:hypothetical protein
MAAPPKYVSSLTGFSLADTRLASGVVNLPAANSLYGRIITFKDQYGVFPQSTLTLSTVGADLFESGQKNLTLSTAYDFVTVIAGSDNKWYRIGQQQAPYIPPANATVDSLLFQNQTTGEPPLQLAWSTSVLKNLTNNSLFTMPIVTNYQVYSL